MDITFILAGFVVGTVVGVTGVGGGSLMTPFLIYYGIPPAIAVGTDLLFAAITKCGGVWAHHNQGTVRWPAVALLAAGSLPATILAVYALGRMREAGFDYQSLITACISVSLLLTSIVLLFKERIEAAGGGIPVLVRFRLHFSAPLTVLAGLLLGGLVTLSSIGAGALGAAILFLLYPRWKAVSVVGTDLAHAVPLAALASFGHLALGNVEPALLAALLIGSLPGIFLGARIGSGLPEEWLRRGLGVMLLCIGVVFALR